MGIGCVDSALSPAQQSAAANYECIHAEVSASSRAQYSSEFIDAWQKVVCDHGYWSDADLCASVPAEFPTVGNRQVCAEQFYATWMSGSSAAFERDAGNALESLGGRFRPEDGNRLYPIFIAQSELQLCGSATHPSFYNNACKRREDGALNCNYTMIRRTVMQGDKGIPGTQNPMYNCIGYMVQELYNFPDRSQTPAWIEDAETLVDSFEIIGKYHVEQWAVADLGQSLYEVAQDRDVLVFRDTNNTCGSNRSAAITHVAVVRVDHGDKWVFGKLNADRILFHAIEESDLLRGLARAYSRPYTIELRRPPAATLAPAGGIRFAYGP